MILAAVALSMLVTVALFEVLSLSLSACQWFFSRRPFLGRRVRLTCSLPGQGAAGGPSPEQPDHYRTSHGRLLSSPSPARFTADLESAAEIR